MSEDNDDDLRLLRNEALRSIGKKANTTATAEPTTLANDRANPSETNSHTKANQKQVGHKPGPTNYYQKQRNGFSRPNLIVLTNQAESDPPVSHARSQSNSYTKLMDKRSESPAKQKRVLPGRFSRRNSDSSEEESDDDRVSDESPSMVISAFEETSNDVSSPSMDVSDIVTNELIPQRSELSDKTSDELNEKQNSSDLTPDMTPSDSLLLTASDRSGGDKRETIKLTTNRISKSDALERRKQKFGDVSESVEASNYCSEDNGIKTSVKSRLSLNTNKRHNNERNERNSRKNNYSEESMTVQKKDRTDERTDRNERYRHSRGDSTDDCDQQSKKRLRSLVVMK